MYRHTPPAAAGGAAQQPGSPDGGGGQGGSTGDAPHETATAVKQEVKQEPADGEQRAAAAAAVKQEEQQQVAEQEPAADEDSGDESDAAGTKPGRAARLRAYSVPPDPQGQCGAWEIVATTLEEFEVRGLGVGWWLGRREAKRAGLGTRASARPRAAAPHCPAPADLRALPRHAAPARPLPRALARASTRSSSSLRRA